MKQVVKKQVKGEARKRSITADPWSEEQIRKDVVWMFKFANDWKKCIYRKSR